MVSSIRTRAQHQQESSNNCKSCIDRSNNTSTSRATRSATPGSSQHRQEQRTSVAILAQHVGCSRGRRGYGPCGARAR
eukprot:9469395-Lingulodinium_polyedra.AAC.1